MRNVLSRMAMLVVLSFGCGQTPQAPGEQATIAGRVLQGGKPVPAGVQIVFFNADKSATLGTTVAEDGKFTLEVADPRIGIPAGRYVVSIRAALPAAVDLNSEDYKRRTLGLEAPAAPESSIPEKFQTFDTSPISLEIRGGPNDVTLELEKF